MRSIFSNPDAHGVRDIEAEVTGGRDRSACLTLTLSGRSFVMGEPLTGEFELFGGPEMAGKFKEVAEAINRIFGHKPVIDEDVQEEARP